METALLARLVADASVSALIGSRAAWGTRIDAAVLPAIVLTRVTGGRDYHHAGADDLATPVVQIDCLAETYAGAVALANAVIAAVEPAGAPFGQSFLRSHQDMTPPTKVDGGQRVYRRMLQFDIFVEE